MARIHLDDVSLQIQLTKQGPMRMRDWLRHRFGLAGGEEIMQIDALRAVDLDVAPGDRIGLIGLNGAGKSTLLKVMAGIYPITGGNRQVTGRVSTLFNVLVGFEQFATGWENIQYRGYLQGESREGLRSKMQAIADFSELGRYLDLPVSTYSAGMKMRLGFSIATAIEPEILLVDEAINAGDIAFREKAKYRIRDMMSTASIVVVATHDRSFLRDLCSHLIWMESGQIRAQGDPDEVFEEYESVVLQGKNQRPGGALMKYAGKRAA